MAVAVATRFKVNGIRYLTRFLWGSTVAALQARRSPGFLAGRLRIDSGGAFWTLTLWQSGRDMVGFRDSGAHAVLTPKLAEWASEAVLGVWNTDALPSWDEVNRRVAEHPRYTAVDDPAPAHVARHFDPTRRGVVAPIPRVRRSRAATGAGR
jgi:hypothetical protein